MIGSAGSVNPNDYVPILRTKGSPYNSSDILGPSIGNLDYFDVYIKTIINSGTTYNQYGVAHEFEHALGLTHPNVFRYGQKVAERRGIMGLGSIVYFDLLVRLLKNYLPICVSPDKWSKKRNTLFWFCY